MHGGHGGAKANGQAPLRRRGIRQDRGCAAGRIPRRHEREAGRRPGADNRPGATALPDIPGALQGIPGARRNAQPLQVPRRAAADAAQSRGGQDRHHNRHPQAHLQGCPHPAPRASDYRRGAALRRQAQATPQGAARVTRHPHHERHPNPPHALHVDFGAPEPLHHHDSPHQPALRADRGRQLRQGADPPGDYPGGRARRPGVLPLQPRPHNREDPRDAPGARPPGVIRGGAWSDEARRTGGGDDTLREGGNRRAHLHDHH